jgi:hypothetical protein
LNSILRRRLRLLGGKELEGVAPPFSLGGILLPKGMPVEILREEDPPEVGMVPEPDPHEVVHLALQKTGRPPDRIDRIDLAAVFPEEGLEPQTMALRDGVQQIDHLEPLFARSA